MLIPFLNVFISDALIFLQQYQGESLNLIGFDFKQILFYAKLMTVWDQIYEQAYPRPFVYFAASNRKKLVFGALPKYI